MKTYTREDHRFIAAAKRENAPAHDLMLEWLSRDAKVHSADALIVSIAAVLLAFALDAGDFQPLFRYAAVAVFVVGFVVMHFVKRKHAKQSDAEVVAFLAERKDRLDAIREIKRAEAA